MALLPKFVNGANYSYCHITAEIGGIKHRGIISINYEDAVEMAKGGSLGRSAAPTHRSSGVYNPGDVTFEGYLNSINAISKQLALLAGGRGISSVEFPISIVYSNPGELAVQDEILRCRVKSISNQFQYGPELLMKSVVIDCMAIIRDGDALFDLSEYYV